MLSEKGIVRVRRGEERKGLVMVRPTSPSSSSRERSETYEVGLGQSVKVTAVLSGSSGVAGVVLWPFVNGSQWGSNPPTNSNGVATITLPFPNTGKAEIVIAVAPQVTPPPFTVGLPLSFFGSSVVLSNTLTVNVTDRPIIRPNPDRGFYVPMEWEPWFTPLNDAWQISEAIPIIGRYDSYNVDVIKQHSIWMSEAGVDSLMVDWTNNLWQKEHWSDRNADIQELCNATTVMLETYTSFLTSSSSPSSIPAPKVILLLGLDNGIQSTTTAIMEELDYIWTSYITNSSISKDLWIIYEDKPLIVVSEGNLNSELKPPFNETRFTVRWMSTQNQNTSYNLEGLWSWMDGSLAPCPTYRNSSMTGEVEALTVTPAFFNMGGWLDPGSYPRLGGTVFVEQFKVAALYRPLFLVINQWNEFDGQANGQGYFNNTIFSDTYSLTLSDDIEPTDIAICSYQRPNQKCGGWGFFYLNLLRALVAMQEMGPNYNFTILTVAYPEPGDVVNTTQMIVRWNTIGVAPKAFEVSIGDMSWFYDPSTTAAVMDLTYLSNGLTSLTVAAYGASTPYMLSYDEVDVALDPMVQPSITINFWLAISNTTTTKY